MKAGETFIATEAPNIIEGDVLYHEGDLWRVAKRLPHLVYLEFSITLLSAPDVTKTLYGATHTVYLRRAQGNPNS